MNHHLVLTLILFLGISAALAIPAINERRLVELPNKELESTKIDAILETCRPSDLDCQGLKPEECVRKAVDQCMAKCKSYRTSVEEGKEPGEFKGFDKQDVLAVCFYLNLPPQPVDSLELVKSVKVHVEKRSVSEATSEKTIEDFIYACKPFFCWTMKGCIEGCVSNCDGYFKGKNNHFKGIDQHFVKKACGFAKHLKQVIKESHSGVQTIYDFLDECHDKKWKPRMELLKGCVSKCGGRQNLKKFHHEFLAEACFHSNELLSAAIDQVNNISKREISMDTVKKPIKKVIETFDDWMGIAKDWFKTQYKKLRKSN